METRIKPVISEIRSFNRFYTNVLGLLNRHILESPYSLTEVRILLEIDQIRDCTANTLIDRLAIDKGYISRILKRFEAAGLVSKENSSADGRALLLYLTPQGKQALSVLEERADSQVYELIGRLTEKEREKLVEAMKYIERALSTDRYPVQIRTFQPGDIDYVIKRHRELYSLEYGFDATFGDYVAETVSKFIEHHDETRENMWVAEANAALAGVIAIVQVDRSTAQLRWFLIEPQMRGRGLGHRLIRTAIDFCKEKNYERVFLWTVNVLEAARHLYQSHGFSLSETNERDIWGKHLTEERWDLSLSDS